MTSLYYDPVVDVHHRLSASLAMVTSYYAGPQEPEDARRLWDAACVSAGYITELPHPLPASRGAPAALILAREWGADDIEARLAAAIESSWEPTWDTDRGEFTWGLGLDEEHPRGQFNAFLAAAEAAGPGAWERLSAAPIDPCPQVVGVDFPRVGLTRAEWQDGSLHLALAPLRDEPGATTTFQLIGVDQSSWHAEGLDAAITPTATGIDITVPLVSAEFVVGPRS